jgi:hypothetical protein
MDKSNSTDESRHQDDEHSETGEPPHEGPAPITIDTADPVIASVQQARGQKRGHHQQDEDDQELQNQGNRDEKQGNSQHSPQDQNGQSKNRGGQQARQHGGDRVHDQEDLGEDGSRQQQPSMTKSLLITAGVALVCGVIGAMSYAYFFGPKSSGRGSEESQSNGDSSPKKESGSKEKSGGGDSKQSGKESDAQASTANSIPGVSFAKGGDMLEQQIKDLSQRVDRLRERVDGVTQPTDATPPSLRMMQIKVSELAHEMAEVAALRAAHRQFDKRLEAFQEELKTLRARTEAPQADRRSASQ